MSHPNYGYGGPSQHPYGGQGYPPQGSYQRQPQGYYPPAQGHPQQYHQGQQQPYAGAPPQQYPPAGYPPQNHPPPSQYPPQQYNQYPPQQHGQYPPPGNYPPQTQGSYPPPQPMPTPPSLGYDPHQKAPGDATREAEALRKAMKGWGTDEKALINVLTKPDPLQMALIRHTYTSHIGRNLEKDLKSELSGNLEDVLLALARGPLEQDVGYAHDAMSGLGTNEKALNDVLLGRSNADLRAIKYAYVATYEKALVDDIKSDLSGKTEQFFVMLVNATRPEPGAYVDPQSVDADVREIHQATKARTGTDETGVSAVFLGASDAKLVAIAQAFEARYHTSLEAVIRDEFSGHLQDAFLSMLSKARDPVGYDADKILECLPADGGADLTRLIYWVVHLHWNPPHFAAVKARLRQKLGHDIGAQWRGAISSGDFHEAMCQLWNAV